jgi:quinoprotein relay system zinc metallohydrolase 2
MGAIKSLGAIKSRIARCLLVCPICLLAIPPALAADLPRGLDVTEPSPGVFVHIGRPVALDAPGHEDIANIGFIVGEKCVAVIDSGGSMRIGRALRAALRERTSLPICYVINTHVHVDHVLGNAAFSGDGPSFVGHAELAEAMVRSRGFFIAEFGGDLDSPPTADQIIGPDRLIGHDLKLDLGGRPLELRAWPRAHTNCDLTVYDPKTGTLWAGDLLFVGRLPALDGSLKGWLAVLDQLERLPVKLAVPGHGPLARNLAAAIMPERRYLQALAAGIRGELSQAKPPQDGIEHVASEEKSRWLLWDNVHPRNVMRAYQELEWE